MLKYLAALVVVLGLAFVVARQDQYATDQAAHKAADLYKAAAPAKPDEQHPQENVRNSAGDSPRWYILCLYSLFRWPNGTETWAIILTLMAIAEQTSQTRRSADISAQTLVAQFRPKVTVRNITLHPKSTDERTAMATKDNSNDPLWNIRLLIVNSGGTAAHIIPSDIKIGWLTLRPEQNESIQTETIEKLLLQPGENRPIDFFVKDRMPSGASIHVCLGVTEIAVSKGYAQEAFITCSGVITYADDIGIKRNTGFDRGYHVESRTFCPSKDTECEYSD